MSLHGEPLFEGLNFKELFGKELIVDKVFWSYDGISLLCVCKDEDEKIVFLQLHRSAKRRTLGPVSGVEAANRTNRQQKQDPGRSIPG